MYVKRDIVTFYKQTILGPLWFVILDISNTLSILISICGPGGEIAAYGSQDDSPAAHTGSGNAPVITSEYPNFTAYFPKRIRIFALNLYEIL